MVCAIAVALANVACGDGDDADNSSSTQGSGGSTAGSGGAPPTTFGGDRAVELHVPESYDPAVAAPLLILLHGYTASGTVQNIYFGLEAPALERGMLYAYPDGTEDDSGARFWNATDGCCDLFGSGVDDSGYLRSLVDDIRAAYNVDAKRIYFIGHSNGSFMSYRMACDHADTIAAIAGLAGATWLDGAECNPSEAVHVLHIHGDMDETVPYEGGTLAAPIPSAVETVEYWAGRASCSLTPSAGTAVDLESAIDGAETSVSLYQDGCEPRGSAELWTIAGGSHVPELAPTFADTALDWLLAHPKP
jgi:polyhydroxybutyrate depolymerase